jgi:hypothetical protein
MDITPDGQYLFTCAILNVDALNSVADGRVYNEETNRRDQSSTLATTDKLSIPFSSTLDQLTSAFMRYVHLSDEEEDGPRVPHGELPFTSAPITQSLDQIEFTLHDTAHQTTLTQRLDELQRPFLQPSRISTQYLTQMNLNLLTSQDSEEISRVPSVTFADPKMPTPEGGSFLLDTLTSLTPPPLHVSHSMASGRETLSF